MKAPEGYARLTAQRWPILEQIKDLQAQLKAIDETTVWPAYDYFYELGEVLSPPAWAQKHDFNES